MIRKWELMQALNESMHNCNLFSSFSLHKGKASLKRIRDLLRVGTIQFGHLEKKTKELQKRAFSVSLKLVLTIKTEKMEGDEFKRKMFI